MPVTPAAAAIEPVPKTARPLCSNWPSPWKWKRFCELLPPRIEYHEWVKVPSTRCPASAGCAGRPCTVRQSLSSWSRICQSLPWRRHWMTRSGWKRRAPAMSSSSGGRSSRW